MAKKSMVAREVKRKKLEQQYSDERATLKQQVLDEGLSEEERREAMMNLQGQGSKYHFCMTSC